MLVSGVRSSWAASWTSCCCCSRLTSRARNIRSKPRARRPTSSSPVAVTGTVKSLVSATASTAAVSDRKGRVVRWASAQPIAGGDGRHRHRDEQQLRTQDVEETVGLVEGPGDLHRSPAGDVLGDHPVVVAIDRHRSQPRRLVAVGDRRRRSRPPGGADPSWTRSIRPCPAAALRHRAPRRAPPRRRRPSTPDRSVPEDWIAGPRRSRPPARGGTGRSRRSPGGRCSRTTHHRRGARSARPAPRRSGRADRRAPSQARPSEERRTKPTPRTVSISRGVPSASSFRRR